MTRWHVLLEMRREAATSSRHNARISPSRSLGNHLLSPYLLFLPVWQAPSISQIYHFILLYSASPIRARQVTYYSPVSVTSTSLISSLGSPSQVNPLSAVPTPRFQIRSHPHYPPRLFHSFYFHYCHHSNPLLLPSSSSASTKADVCIGVPVFILAILSSALGLWLGSWS
jgi:hypothetical protein